MKETEVGVPEEARNAVASRPGGRAVAMAEGGVPAVETQRVDMSTLLRTNLKKGDTW